VKSGTYEREIEDFRMKRMQHGKIKGGKGGDEGTLRDRDLNIDIHQSGYLVLMIQSVIREGKISRGEVKGGSLPCQRESARFDVKRSDGGGVEP